MMHFPRARSRRSKSKSQSQSPRRLKIKSQRSRQADNSRPVAAYRQRGVSGADQSPSFYAQEVWHCPTGNAEIKYVVQSPGVGYVHPVTVDEVKDRLAQLPSQFTDELDVVQLSGMTRKRSLFPCYGMQWGTSIYLYPIEESLEEVYVRPPRPEQQIEARMFGGKWTQSGSYWILKWTADSVRDFYLNNVLIHEVGHINDARNSNFDARERFANWFAIEYGYRRSRHRKPR